MKRVWAAAAAVLLASGFAASAAGQSVKGYTLELYDGDMLFHDAKLMPRLRSVSAYSYSIFRVPAGARTPEGERVYAFQIVQALRGDAVHVEALALLEDPDTVTEEHPMHGLRKQPAGVYEVRAGESVPLQGMERFGVRPLTARARQEGTWF